MEAAAHAAGALGRKVCIAHAVRRDAIGAAPALHNL